MKLHLSERPLIAREKIERRVAELASKVDTHFASEIGEGEVVGIAVLKGSLFFAADLLRQMKTRVLLDFISVRSYRGTESTGDVQIAYWPETPLKGRHVLVIEDILDTGRTLSVLLERLRAEGPASVSLCVLLDKPERREIPVTADYIGFDIDNHFVVGYGLDCAEFGRQLQDIYVLEP